MENNVFTYEELKQKFCSFIDVFEEIPDINNFYIQDREDYKKVEKLFDYFNKIAPISEYLIQFVKNNTFVTITGRSGFVHEFDYLSWSAIPPVTLIKSLKLKDCNVSFNMKKNCDILPYNLAVVNLCSDFIYRFFCCDFNNLVIKDRTSICRLEDFFAKISECQLNLRFSLKCLFEKSGEEIQIRGKMVARIGEIREKINE